MIDVDLECIHFSSSSISIRRSRRRHFDNTLTNQLAAFLPPFVRCMPYKCVYKNTYKSESAAAAVDRSACQFAGEQNLSFALWMCISLVDRPTAFHYHFVITFYVRFFSYKTPFLIAIV
jgi:hypothetical protein